MFFMKLSSCILFFFLLLGRGKGTVLGPVITDFLGIVTTSHLAVFVDPGFLGEGLDEL